MTPEDVRIIFSNIEELARFSDEFGELLEEALGSLIDGGVGEDRVGALFLELVGVQFNTALSVYTQCTHF